MSDTERDIFELEKKAQLTEPIKIPRSARDTTTFEHRQQGTLETTIKDLSFSVLGVKTLKLLNNMSTVQIILLTIVVMLAYANAKPVSHHDDTTRRVIKHHR